MDPIILRVTFSGLFDDDGICGYCDGPGADKMTGGIYWPGEYRPKTEMVHEECQRAEQGRAHAALGQSEREAFLRRI